MYKLYDIFFHFILEPSAAMHSGTTNNLSPPNITIYFTPAKGIVDYYNATLIGDNPNATTKNVSNATNHVMADTTGITKQHKLEFVIMYIYYLPPVPHILA